MNYFQFSAHSALTKENKKKIIQTRMILIELMNL